MIIDDFDSGIDGVRLALLTELIHDAQRTTGGTYLVTTHDMNAARTLADHAVVINAGRIVAEGPAGEVLGSAEPLVHQLVEGGARGPADPAWLTPGGALEDTNPLLSFSVGREADFVVPEDPIHGVDGLLFESSPIRPEKGR